MTEWMKQVNAILKRHRIARDGVLIRFSATKYPIPSVAVVVYESGEKIGEFSIRNLAEFIADLNTVLSIIRIHTSEEQGDSEQRSYQRKKKVHQKQSADEPDEEEVEEEEDAEVRRKQKIRRKPRRD